MTPHRTIYHAALAAALSLVAAPGCRQGPVNYDKFEKRTVEKNLAAVDSARTLYWNQIQAGNPDAGAQQACAFLLTQPGVDTAGIGLDSTVWVFFSDGLLSGVCDDRVDTTGSLAPLPTRRSEVQAAGGGEVGDFAHYLLPFNAELPGTARAADAISGIFRRKLNWDESETYNGSGVTLGIAMGAISPGTGVLFWSGHGLLMPPDEAEEEDEVSSLETGTPFTTEAAATEAVTEYAGYVHPGPGKPVLCSVIQRVSTGMFHIVILPAFVRAFGNFNVAETLPGYNLSKTIVYLSCCYSSYSAGGGTGELVQAFLDAGADVVCGYSWEVGDPFSCDKDSSFFKAMADTCFPLEAVSTLGNLTDPVERHKRHATFQVAGDSMVLLRAVCQAEKDGELLRATTTTAYLGGTSGVSSLLHPDGSAEDAGDLFIGFPGTSPGDYFTATTDGVSLTWADLNSGHYYYAAKNYVGVSGEINIVRCRSDAITGSFEGTLGYWAPGLDPTQDPPSDVVTFANGVVRYTGKITVGKLAAR